MKLLHDYIRPVSTVKSITAKRKTNKIRREDKISNDCNIPDLVQKSKNESLDIIELFRNYFVVEEITV